MKPVTGLISLVMLLMLTTATYAEEKPNSLIGSHLYRSYCLVCHGKEGNGNGPLAKKKDLRPADLSSGKYQKEKIGTLAETIGRYRKDADSNMPNWGLVLPEDDIKHIAAYITTMSNKGLKFRGNTRRGRIIYKNACIACHDKNGKGNGLLAQLIRIEMVDFSHPESMQKLSDDQLLKTIREGKGDFMPPWAGALNDDEIIDVASYVRLLGR
ncbi:MAG: c-type cytochrome [Rhodospirillales bacterium]|nr:c-type cytochrome [Alphaproteobacteria bacterium]MBL6947386.1 c-type cytochrome [Rhodospirillales bacterium]